MLCRIGHAQNPERFSWTFCDKEFKTRQHLESHIPAHTIDKRFKCDHLWEKVHPQR